MGERGVRNAEVEGSNPLPSTMNMERDRLAHRVSRRVTGARHVDAGGRAWTSFDPRRAWEVRARAVPAAGAQILSLLLPRPALPSLA